MPDTNPMEVLQKDLAAFSPRDTKLYYTFPSFVLRYSEGIKYLINNCDGMSVISFITPGIQLLNGKDRLPLFIELKQFPRKGTEVSYYYSENQKRKVFTELCVYGGLKVDSVKLVYFNDSLKLINEAVI